MADAKKDAQGKKSTNPLVFVGIGCLVLLVVLGIASSIVMKFFAKKVSTGLLQGFVESKTGVKTNIQDLEKGKMTFTDPKTGAKVEVGSNVLPDNFPKDFPVYPGAKVLSSLAGGGKADNGFWLTLGSGDSSDKVSAYYKSELVSKGWEIKETFTMGEIQTYTVSKGALEGTVAVTSQNDNKETAITIVLGTDK